MITVCLLILISAILVSLGQVFFKRGVMPFEKASLRGLSAYAKFMGSVFKTPAIWLGFLAIGAGIVVWLMALAQTDLSIAFPIDSVQYLVILVSARFFLGEKIDQKKLWGTLLVMAGIFLIAIS